MQTFRPMGEPRLNDSRWVVEGFQMDILATLKKEQTKLQQQLNGIQVGIAALSGANKTPVERSARQWKRHRQEVCHVRCSKGEDFQGG